MPTSPRSSATYKLGYKEGYDDAEKAYGKCHNCYGKGYSTTTVTGKLKINTCTCDRGKQIIKVLNAHALS